MPGVTQTRPARFGLYDKRIVIQTIRTQPSDDGSPAEVATEFAKRWASINPGTGREYVQADSVMADVSNVLEMRYIAGVTPKHRVLFGARVFEIIFVENMNEANRVTRLYCKEKVS